MKMFVAGPVNVTNDVKQAMIHDEIGHREVEFENLYKQIKDKLKLVFNADTYQYDSLIVGGSGTAAIETVLSSILYNDKKILVISNGAFGERISDICKLHNKPIHFLQYDWGKEISLVDVENAMIAVNDVDTVIMVHMETSTGMLNPINDIGKLCKKYNKTFIVDAVSSLGGEKLSMIKDNIDVCITNTNKCLGGVPVLGIICYDVNFIKKRESIKPQTYSLDFFKHVKYAQQNQTPFTPHISLFFMLNQALTELLEEGIKNRQLRYERNGRILKQRLFDMGFKFQLNSSMSNLMVNAYIPKGFTYKVFSKKLREKGYICYPYKAESKKEIIHIANVGTLTNNNVNQFCDDIEVIINDINRN